MVWITENKFLVQEGGLHLSNMYAKSLISDVSYVSGDLFLFFTTPWDFFLILRIYIVLFLCFVLHQKVFNNFKLRYFKLS